MPSGWPDCSSAVAAADEEVERRRRGRSVWLAWPGLAVSAVLLEGSCAAPSPLGSRKLGCFRED